jgi:molybdopterin converting factor small subunit
MSTKVIISHLLQEYADIPAALEVDGDTVRECLEDFIRQFPESGNWLFGRDSLMRVAISINNAEMVTIDKEGLDRKLKSADKLKIFAVMSGG